MRNRSNLSKIAYVLFSCIQQKAENLRKIIEVSENKEITQLSFDIKGNVVTETRKIIVYKEYLYLEGGMVSYIFKSKFD